MDPLLALLRMWISALIMYALAYVVCALGGATYPDWGALVAVTVMLTIQIRLHVGARFTDEVKKGLRPHPDALVRPDGGWAPSATTPRPLSVEKRNDRLGWTGQPLPTGNRVLNMTTGTLEWDSSKFVGNTVRTVVDWTGLEELCPRDSDKWQAVQAVLESGEYPTQRALVPPFTKGKSGSYSRLMSWLWRNGLAFERQAGPGKGWGITPRGYRLFGVNRLPYRRKNTP